MLNLAHSIAPPSASDAWPESAIEILIACIDKGWSAHQAVHELAEAGMQYTRNACLAKSHRLVRAGLIATPFHSQPPGKPRAQCAAKKPAKPFINGHAAETETATISAPISAPITTLALTSNDLGPDPAHAKSIIDVAPRQCRWPYGEPSEEAFRFCGIPTRDGVSYCDEKHFARVYQKQLERRR